ncbi:MAG TPA: ATP cone domain-containing protein, partial [Candidatus Saccharimonadia bacterium]|nr:ATP cone domain-containing protein [Candidatus Saccharimonadia bacterium]
MKCPFCRSNQTEVYNTRTTKSGGQLWRRRRCQVCHEAFTTYEAPDLHNILRVSQDGRQTPYSRARLYAALVRALEGHSNAADALTDTIEAKILDLKTRIVSVDQVASVVLS